MTPRSDPAAEFFPPPRPPSKRRIWPFVLLGVLAGGLLVFAVAAAAFVGLVRGKSVVPNSVDRDLVPDLSVLSPWMNGYTFTEDHETFLKTRYFDGSFDLDYTYDHPSDPDAPYFSYIVSFQPTTSDARTVFHSYWIGLATILKFSSEIDIQIDEDSVQYTWGDQSHFVLLVGDGSPYGNAFAARDGTRAISVVISNFYFEAGEDFAEFIEPFLDKLEPYEASH